MRWTLQNMFGFVKAFGQMFNKLCISIIVDKRLAIQNDPNQIQTAIGRIVNNSSSGAGIKSILQT